MTDPRNYSVTLNHLFWLIPCALALHNLEEAVTMPQWVVEHDDLIRAALPFRVPIEFSPAQILCSLSLATILPVMVTALCWKAERGSVRSILLFILQGIVLINVFIPHVAVSLRFGEYNPGIVTALLCNLPFSAYLMYRGLKEGYLRRRQLALLALGSVVAYPLTVLVIHFGGEAAAGLL